MHGRVHNGQIYIFRVNILPGHNQKGIAGKTMTHNTGANI
uniref:Uncharacterized protein n=1 Tax=Anguilla anguilla TaxID=7936 RepID=A0A0E9RZK3_ANGAN